MKVRELIKLLKKEDQEEEILFEIPDCGSGAFYSSNIEVANEFYNPEEEKTYKTLPAETLMTMNVVVLLRIKE